MIHCAARSATAEYLVILLLNGEVIIISLCVNINISSVFFVILGHLKENYEHMQAMILCLYGFGKLLMYIVWS